MSGKSFWRRSSSSLRSPSLAESYTDTFEEPSSTSSTSDANITSSLLLSPISENKENVTSSTSKRKPCACMVIKGLENELSQVNEKLTAAENMEQTLKKHMQNIGLIANTFARKEYSLENDLKKHKEALLRVEGKLSEVENENRCLIKEAAERKKIHNTLVDKQKSLTAELKKNEDARRVAEKKLSEVEGMASKALDQQKTFIMKQKSLEADLKLKLEEIAITDKKLAEAEKQKVKFENATLEYQKIMNAAAHRNKTNSEKEQSLKVDSDLKLAAAEIDKKKLAQELLENRRTTNSYLQRIKLLEAELNKRKEFFDDVQKKLVTADHVVFKKNDAPPETNVPQRPTIIANRRDKSASTSSTTPTSAAPPAQNQAQKCTSTVPTSKVPTSAAQPPAAQSSAAQSPSTSQPSAASPVQNQAQKCTSTAPPAQNQAQKCTSTAQPSTVLPPTVPTSKVPTSAAQPAQKCTSTAPQTTSQPSAAPPVQKPLLPHQAKNCTSTATPSASSLTPKKDLPPETNNHDPAVKVYLDEIRKLDLTEANKVLTYICNGVNVTHAALRNLFQESHNQKINAIGYILTKQRSRFFDEYTCQNRAFAESKKLMEEFQKKAADSLKTTAESQKKLELLSSSAKAKDKTLSTVMKKYEDLEKLYSEMEKSMTLLKADYNTVKTAAEVAKQKLGSVGKFASTKDSRVYELEQQKKDWLAKEKKQKAEINHLQDINKKNRNFAQEVDRLKSIIDAHLKSIEMLKADNEQLKIQNSSKYEKMLELKTKWVTSEAAMEMLVSRSTPNSTIDAMILKRKKELEFTRVELVKQKNRSDEQEKLELLMNAPGMSSKDKSQANTHFQLYAEQIEQNLKILKANLKLIQEHYEFRAEKLSPIPDIPQPFSQKSMKIIEAQLALLDKKKRLKEEKVAKILDGECPVCLEKVDPTSEHRFWCDVCKRNSHEECALNWFENSFTCPACQTPLASSSH